MQADIDLKANVEKPRGDQQKIAQEKNNKMLEDEKRRTMEENYRRALDEDKLRIREEATRQVLENERRRAQEEEKNRILEEEKQRALEEEKRLALEEEKRRVMEDEKRKALEEEKRQAIMEAEKLRVIERAAEVEKRRRLAEFLNKIIMKIKANINNQPCQALFNPEVEFEVRLMPTGMLLLDPVLKHSSSNAQCDKAIERAILRAQPLPLPADPALFNDFRELSLKFRPNQPVYRSSGGR